MPKRVIDFDALWASDKIASCPGWAQAEYAWLYGLADASGSFELTNLRVIWGRVAAVRKDLTIERLGEVFQEFIARGLLFTWECGGKRYGHWTGSDVPGRLPPPSWRARLERLAPPVPRRELAEYMARFSSRRQGALAFPVDAETTATASTGGPLKPCRDAPQAQEWEVELEVGNEKEREKTQMRETCESSVSMIASVDSLQFKASESSHESSPTFTAEEMERIYERERGRLPATAGLTPERRRRCQERIREGLTREEFASAVRRATETPFLAGEGSRGWRASFDWLIANGTNVRKVLAGAYDAAPPRGSEDARGEARQRAVVNGPGHWSGKPMDQALYSAIHVGKAPVAAECGVRVRPEVLERIRARDAARGSG